MIYLVTSLLRVTVNMIYLVTSLLRATVNMIYLVSVVNQIEVGVKGRRSRGVESQGRRAGGEERGRGGEREGRREGGEERGREVDLLQISRSLEYHPHHSDIGWRFVKERLHIRKVEDRKKGAVFVLTTSRDV